jgi:hypothetical protein
MKHLDVAKVHTGLQIEFGLEFPLKRIRTDSVVTYLVSRSWLPITVGWMDNRMELLRGAFNYALATYTKEPVSMHHRLMLAQDKGRPCGVHYVEDATELVHGDARESSITNAEVLGLPDIDMTIRDLLVGAYVLDHAIGQSFDEFASRNPFDIDTIRSYGQTIINPKKPENHIDDKNLDRYAQIDIPVFYNIV